MNDFNKSALAQYRELQDEIAAQRDAPADEAPDYGSNFNVSDFPIREQQGYWKAPARESFEDKLRREIDYKTSKSAYEKWASEQVNTSIAREVAETDDLNRVAGKYKETRDRAEEAKQEFQDKLKTGEVYQGHLERPEEARPWDVKRREYGGALDQSENIPVEEGRYDIEGLPRHVQRRLRGRIGEQIEFGSDEEFLKLAGLPNGQGGPLEEYTGQDEAQRLQQTGWLMNEADTPDQIAKDQELAEKEGVPAFVVAQDRKRFSINDVQRRMDDAFNGAPKLQEQMADRDFFNVAYDSVEQLSAIEQVFKRAGRLGLSASGEGVRSVGSGVRGIGELYESNVVMPLQRAIYKIPGAQAGFEAADEALPIPYWLTPSGYAKTLGGTIADAGEGLIPDQQTFDEKVAGALGQIATAVGLSFTGAGAIGTTGLFAGMGADQQAQQMRELGLDPNQMPAQVATGAIITGLSEQLRLGSILKLLPQSVRSKAMGNVFARITGQAGEEAIQEAAENIAQNAIAMTYDENAELLEGAGEGAVVGGSASAIFQTLVELILPGKQRMTAARDAAEVAKEMRKEMEAAPFFERAPAKAKEFLDGVTEDQEVYINPEDFLKLYQEDTETYYKILEEVGVSREEVEEAVMSGSDIAVKGSAILTVSDSEQFNALVDVMRTDPDAMSTYEVRESLREKELEFDHERMLELYEQDDSDADTYTRVSSAVQEAAVSAGRSPQEAEAAGSIWGARFKRLEDDGIDAQKVFEKLGLQVRQVDEQGQPIQKTIRDFWEGPKPKEPQSLNKWIAAQGGISEAGMGRGDVMQAIGQKKSAARGVFNENGTPLDMMARQAAEAGFDVDPEDVQSLLDAISNDAQGGTPLYRAGEADEWNAYQEALDQIEEANTDRRGDVKKLTQAQEQGYKGRDIGEAIEWTEAIAKGLDMSQEARMQRAKDMGFDTDTVLYHGMSGELEDNMFRPSSSGSYGEGVYFSSMEGFAKQYATLRSIGGTGEPNVVQAYVRGKFADSKEWFSKFDTGVTGPEVNAALREEGFDGVRVGNEIVVFDPTNIRSVNAAFDPDYADSPNILRQLAGESAASANSKKLDRAKRMLDDGASVDEVWEKTGWYKGVEGKWRFEIDNNKAAINKRLLKPNPSNAKEKYFNGTLFEILKHKKLFQAYPELKNLKVKIGPQKMFSSAGSFQEDTISINQPEDEILSTLLHEVQHWIQEKEGFLRGGNKNTIRSQAFASMFEIDEQIRRASEGGIGHNFVPYLQDLRRSLENTLEVMGDSHPMGTGSAEYSIYTRIGGEVEARNVQARLNMKPRDRRKINPELTQDTPASQMFDPEVAQNVEYVAIKEIKAALNKHWDKSKDVYPNHVKGQPINRQSDISLFKESTKDNVASIIGEFGLDAFLAGSIQHLPKQIKAMDKSLRRAEGYAENTTKSWYSKEREDELFAVVELNKREIEKQKRFISLLEKMQVDASQELKEGGFVIKLADPDSDINVYEGPEFDGDRLNTLRQEVEESAKSLWGEHYDHGTEHPEFGYWEDFENHGLYYLAYDGEPDFGGEASAVLRFKKEFPDLASEYSRLTRLRDYESIKSVKRKARDGEQSVQLFQSIENTDFTTPQARKEWVEQNTISEHIGGKGKSAKRYGFQVNGSANRVVVQLDPQWEEGAQVLTINNADLKRGRVGGELDLDADGLEGLAENLSAILSQNLDFPVTVEVGNKAEQDFFLEVFKQVAEDNGGRATKAKGLGVYYTGPKSSKKVTKADASPVGEKSVDDETKFFNRLNKFTTAGYGRAEARGGDGASETARRTLQTQEEQAEREAKLRSERSYPFPRSGLYQKDGKQARGFVEIPKSGVLSDAAVVVSLTKARDLEKAANASTFIHETAHIFLELEMSLESESPAIKARMDAVREWLGIEEGDRPTVAQHEKFAESFEAYLFEGKSPNAELRGVFRKFKTWLLDIYVELRGKRKLRNLEPAAREIFDGMLATQVEIEQAQRDFMGPLASAMRDVMSPEQIEKYKKYALEAGELAKDKLFAKYLDGIKKREGRERRQQRKDLTADVAEKLLEQPVFKAQDAMAGATGRKLGTSDVVEMRGEDNASMTKDYHTEGGEHPELVAPDYGFLSGDEMLQALEEAPTLKAAVKSEVDRMMKELHGDMLADGTMESEAVEAVFNDKAVKAMEVERNAMAEKAAGDPIPLNEIKAYAEFLITKKPIKEILTPAKYAMQGRNLHKKAVMLAAKGKWDEALNTAHKAMLQHELARRAYKTREEYEKINRFLKRFSPRKKLDSKKIDPAYIEQIRRYYALPGAENQQDEFAILNEFAEQQADEGNAVLLNNDIISNQPLPEIRDMTMEQLRDYRDGLKNLNHLGRANSEEKRAAFNANVSDMADTVISAWGDKPQKEFTRSETGFEKVSGWIRKFDSDILRWPFIVESLQGGKSGKIVDALDTKLRLQLTERNSRRRDMSQKLAAIFKKHGITQAELNKRVSEEVIEKGKSVKFEAVMAVALNMGTAQNRSRLESDITINGDQADIQAMLDARLDKRHWDAAQEIWDLIGSMWPEASAVHRNTTGVVPKKVDAQKVQTKHGVYDGGYYPIKYDHNAVENQDIADRDAKDLWEQQIAGVATSAQTKQGFLKERQENVSRPVRLSMDVVLSHIDDVTNDIYMREVVNDVWRIVTNKATFAPAVSATHGKEYIKSMKTILQRTVAGAQRPANGFEQLFRTFRINSSIAILGNNIVSAGLAPISYFQTVIPRYGAKTVLRGMTEFYGGGPVETVKIANMITEKSTFMRERTDTLNREAHEMITRNKLQGTWGKIQNSGFLLMAYMEKYSVSGPTWLGVYREALDAGKSEKVAITEADRAVATTQGSGLELDQSVMQSGGEFDKLMTYMYGYVSGYYGVVRSDVANADGVKKLMPLVKHLVILNIAASMAEALLRHGIGDEEDPYYASVLELMARNTFGLVPGLSTALSKYSTEPAASAFGTKLGKAAQTYYDAGSEFMEDGYIEGETLRKALIQTGEAAGFALGVPGTTQLKKIEKTLTEDDDPTLYEALVTGPDDDN